MRYISRTIECEECCKEATLSLYEGDEQKVCLCVGCAQRLYPTEWDNLVTPEEE